MAQWLGSRTPAVCGGLLLAAVLGCGGGDVPLKVVNFGNGIFSFRVPAAWTAIPGRDGGMTFKADSPEGGTLTVTSAKESAHWNVTAGSLRSGLGKAANLEYGGARSFLTHKGNALVSYGKRFVEGDQVLYRQFWKHGVPIPPEWARITTFVYTIPAQQQDAEATQAMLKVLEREIADAEFSS